MATKRVDQLAASTTVASTDLIPIATSAGTLRKVSPAVLLQTAHQTWRTPRPVYDPTNTPTTAFVAAATALPNIVALWPLVDGTDAIGALDGTLGADVVTGIPFGDGTTGVSQMTNAGATTGVVIPDNAALDLVDVFSAFGWVRRRDHAWDTWLFGKGGWDIGIDTANRLFLAVFTGSRMLSQPTAIADGLWHFVVATKNGATIKFYVDGVDVTGTPVNATMLSGTGNDLYLLSRVTSDFSLHGAAKYLGLVSRAITAAEVAALYAAARPWPQPPVQPKYGFHQDLMYRNVAEHVDRVGRVVAIDGTTTRHTLAWHLIQPGAAEPAASWTAMDSVVDTTVERGIEPVLIVAGSPQWASGHATEIFHVPGTGVDATFLAWRAKYVTFITAAVARYKDRVQRWELGNEENQDGFWHPAANVAQYASWYGAVRAAILAVDPSAKVAVGGLDRLRFTTTGITGRQFLIDLVATGVTIDAVAIHPYQHGTTEDPAVMVNNNNFNDIIFIKDTLVECGLPDATMWVTEFGWSTDVVSQASQALFLTICLERIRDYFAAWVDIVHVFTDSDWPAAFAHGLYTDAGVAKPGATAFALFAEPVRHPVVTGSWSDGTAAASLAAVLDRLGLAEDATTG